MTFVQSSLERSSEEVMRSYIGQRVEQYSFAAQPILVGLESYIASLVKVYGVIRLVQLLPRALCCTLRLDPKHTPHHPRLDGGA